MISRTVEVGREEIDGVQLVLLPVRLGLNKEELLGQAVGGVCLLGVPVPEVVFFEGDRREFGVRAHGPDGHEFSDPGLAGGLHQLEPHQGVVVQKLSRVPPAIPDPADLPRQVDHEVHSFHRPLAVFPSPEVMIPASGDLNGMR